MGGRGSILLENRVHNGSCSGGVEEGEEMDGGGGGFGVE